MSDYGPYYLREILNCRFQGIIDEAMELYGINVTRNIIRRAFDKISQRIPLKSVKHTEEYCSKHKHVLAKVISIHNLTNLLPLMNEGVKVINLVRDPRSTFASRCKLQWVKENRKKAEKQTLEDYYRQLLSKGKCKLWR